MYVSIVLPVLGFLWPRLTSEAVAAACEPSGPEMLTLQLTSCMEINGSQCGPAQNKKDKALICYSVKINYEVPLNEIKI